MRKMENFGLINYNYNSKILYSTTLTNTINQISNFILNSQNKEFLFNNKYYEIKKLKKNIKNSFCLCEKSNNNQLIIYEEILVYNEFNIQILYSFSSFNNKKISQKIGILLNLFDITCEDKSLIILEKYSEIDCVKMIEIENIFNFFDGKNFLEKINKGLNEHLNEILVLFSTTINKSIYQIYNYAININLIYSKFDNFKSHLFEMEGNLGEIGSIFYVFNKQKNVFIEYTLVNKSYNKHSFILSFEYSKKCNGEFALNERIIFKIIPIEENLTWIFVKNKVISPSKFDIKILKQYIYYYITKIKN